MDGLPPLNALRMFIVAARHLSFTRAAAELNVTHGAVSRQVRGLESHLGVALFERRVRQVSLTPEGQQLFAEVEPALEQIGAAARALTARVPQRIVRINARPSFTVRWLLPQLANFVAQHPGIEPQFVTSTLAPAKSPEPFDIAIRRGREDWPTSLKVQSFLKDELVLVAAPSLLKQRPIREPQSLSSHVLLSCKTRRQDWEGWKAHIGLPKLKPAKRLLFDHIHFVLQAAANGLGVALTPASYVGPDFPAGRLIMPLPKARLPLEPVCFAIAHNPSREGQIFADWLGAQGQSAVQA